jgi:transposase
VVLEATADVLHEEGAGVHLAHPLGVKGFAYRRVKNDERDTADLADLLRMGRLPEAWIAPPETRELRELVRHRRLCRRRHNHLYAEGRIMPSGVVDGVSLVVIGWRTSA